MGAVGWLIRCFWKSASDGSPMHWSTQSSHTTEQQARSTALNVYTAYQGMEPITIDAIEIKAPHGDWRPLLPGPRVPAEQAAQTR